MTLFYQADKKMAQEKSQSKNNSERKGITSPGQKRREEQKSPASLTGPATA